MLGLSLPVVLLFISVQFAFGNLHRFRRDDSTPSVAAAWFTGWHATDFPLSQVSWSKYTHLIYAFAVTTPDVNTLSLDISDETLLPQFVSTARQQNVKASLSIGGWTGSRYFSSNIGSAKNRTAFVKTVTDIATKFNLDGLDFDWEFPRSKGIGCNGFNPNDTSNFLSFFQELRRHPVGQKLILSAATVTPWIDSSGAPSSDVSGFSEVIDFITIMNYDIQSSPSVGAGPSSPLNDACAPEGARFGSAASAVQAWTDAGMPANQIILGVPAYGHAFTLNNNETGASDGLPRAYPSYNPAQKRPGDRWDSDGGIDVCGILEGPGAVYTYWGLIEQGFLNADGSVKDGIAYRFDNCSQTPFVYNPTNRIYVSFENAQSFAAKGEFINSTGLAGFAIWEAGGDSFDVLLNSIKNSTINGPIGTQNAANKPVTNAPPTSSAATVMTPVLLINALGPVLLLVVLLLST